jgi:hypothetical protein
VANTLKEWKLRRMESPFDLVFPNGKGNVEDLVNIVKRGLIPAGITAKVTMGIYGDACVPTFLCLMVHRPKLAAEGDSGAARTRLNHHNL